MGLEGGRGEGGGGGDHHSQQGKMSAVHTRTRKRRSPLGYLQRKWRVLYLEVVLARLEYPGGAEEHGHMRVVAARVHLPGVPALVLPLHGLLMRAKQKDDDSGLHYEQANAYANVSKKGVPSFSS
jgi:hypothetical protein